MHAIPLRNAKLLGDLVGNAIGDVINSIGDVINPVRNVLTNVASVIANLVEQTTAARMRWLRLRLGRRRNKILTKVGQVDLQGPC